MSNKSKRGRPIQGQSREILWNVHNFMTKEAQEVKNRVFDPARFADVLDRTARATKVPHKTVKRLLHRKTVQDLNHARPKTGSKEIRHEGRRRILERVYLHDHQYESMRHIIYDLHLARKQQVTMTALLNKLIEVNFPGVKGHLRQLVKELGFTYKKCNTYQNILIERPESRLLRIKYLKQIKKYRHEGRNIIYGNEMSIHLSSSNEIIPPYDLSKIKRNQYSTKITAVYAGNEQGFVPNTLSMNVSEVGDQQNPVNKEKYEMWLLEQLVPNLPRNTIFVVDNVTYNRTLEEKAPNSKATTKTMQDWLTSKNIQFNPTMLKPELYNIIKLHKHQYVKYSLDTIMELYGHKVVVLPPYFPRFNPMKMASAIIEDYLISVYQWAVGMSISEVLNVFAKRFAAFEEEEWARWLHSAIGYEDEILAKDDLYDVQNQLTENYFDDASTSGSSHGDSTDESSDVCCEVESGHLQPSSSRFMNAFIASFGSRY